MAIAPILQRQLVELGLEISPGVAGQLVTLLNELLNWNKTYNLTSITDPHEAVEKHLVDSLTLLPHTTAGARLLDIGSGAGFPGLPLKIARPGLELVSVDAVAKKIRFQKHIVRKLGLAGVIAWHGRAEEVPEQPFSAGGYDMIVARAFSSLEKQLDLALPCLKPGGRIVAMKGPEGEGELAAAANYLAEHGIECVDRVSLALPASGAQRQLLFFGR